MKYKLFCIMQFYVASSYGMFQIASPILKRQKLNNFYFASKLIENYFSKSSFGYDSFKDTSFAHSTVCISGNDAPKCSDPENKKTCRFNSLIYAIEQNDMPAIEEILERKFFGINMPGAEGNTAMHIATKNATVLKKLLKKTGANKECFNIKDERPLHVACVDGNLETVKILLDHGAKKDPKDVVGQTPLFKAVEQNNLSIALLLLENGCNVRHVDKNDTAPLDIAVTKNFINMAGLLLKNGALINRVRGESTQTVLHEASSLGHAALITILGNYHANVNAQNAQGDTPLHLLVKKILEVEDNQQYYRALKNLFDFQPNIYLKNKDHKDVFDLIGLTNKNNRKIAQLLLYYWSINTQTAYDEIVSD